MDETKYKNVIKRVEGICARHGIFGRTIHSGQVLMPSVRLEWATNSHIGTIIVWKNLRMLSQAMNIDEEYMVYENEISIVSTDCVDEEIEKYLSFVFD